MNAVIIARGGSKRLPRKNVHDFCGHPLVAWSIVQAKNSHYIDRVFVSTDDDEIQEISESYGAEVIRRPPEHPYASANIPYVHATNWIIEKYGKEVSQLHILPTSPVRKPEDMDNLISLFNRLKVLEMGTVTKSPEIVIFEQIGGYKFRCKIGDKRYNYFMSSMGFNATDIDYFLEINQKDQTVKLDNYDEKAVNSIKDLYAYVGEPWQGFDIDYLDDLKICEAMMEIFILKGRGIEIYKEYGILKEIEYNGRDIKPKEKTLSSM